MLPTSSPNTGTTGSGGYECRNCGAWVPSGAIHECGILGTPSTLSPATNVEALNRIARALEKIAEALDKLWRVR